MNTYELINLVEKEIPGMKVYYSLTTANVSYNNNSHFETVANSSLVVAMQLNIFLSGVLLSSRIERSKNVTLTG